MDERIEAKLMALAKAHSRKTAVWQVKEALEQAYAMGAQDAAKMARKGFWWSRTLKRFVSVPGSES